MVGLLAMSPSAQAAEGLYCSVDFSGRNCLYATMEACRAALGVGQGDCVLNPAALPAPTGAARFCLAERWKLACDYATLAGCQRAAAPRHAQCVDNPNYR
ncbi:hypothetical protein MAIT1_01394 [Magnetofaba australis IT-1]|uniref:DUF3551 domain-containing protein n=2 Tax=Magnetofaba TaxID=1472292 RepID=A0A1Y2K2M3_9PROT|nr:hypothetical protein MAIT1_01394 [Magnetofaba australis IT-1]